MQARALRFVAPRRIEIHETAVRPPVEGEVLVRTTWSGISGGTELLAYRGELDEDLERDEGLASLGGTFRYPFAYGYSCVGRVERSAAEGFAEGASVFAFHPHQDVFAVPASEVLPVEGVDARVATTFPLVETALQVTLDAGGHVGDPVLVLGLGPVGVLVGAVMQRAGAEVLGVDPREDRRRAAEAFGVPAVDVSAARGRGDVPLVVEASGAPDAVRLALELLAHEGEALVCGWYGSKEVSLPLGGRFHRRRLTIRSTQVSTVPARLAGRWDVGRRRRATLKLMGELPLKLLATHEIAFERAAEAYRALDRGESGMMHVALRY